MSILTLSPRRIGAAGNGGPSSPGLFTHRHFTHLPANLMRGSPILLHLLRPVIQLGPVPVVGRAEEADVAWIVTASEGEGVPVVILEPVSLRASSSLRVDEAALAAVATVDDATDRGRDVPREAVGPASPVPGRLRLRESSSLEALPQFPHRSP